MEMVLIKIHNKHFKIKNPTKKHRYMRCFEFMAHPEGFSRWLMPPAMQP